MADIGSVKYKVELDNSGLDKDLSTTEKTIIDKLKDLKDTMEKSFGYQILKDVGSAFIDLGKQVAGFAADSVKVGAEFDASMSQVAATMGTTVDQIGELRDFAQEMGATTAFSASQAAEALNYMALAGYDAETSMAMLPNVLNLAAAGGMELATASDMVTDASSALGLSLEETSALVDKMAAASSKSNTSVAQLGDAILQIGGTAKMMSGGTTELSTALGILADNGIKGAEGGTALRNILLNLTPKSEAAAKAFKQLGLNAYDSSGKMRPLEDIFADLNAGLADMTDEQKTNVLSNIFNKVDLKSVNALLATDAERWQELATAIDGAWYTSESITKSFQAVGLSMESMQQKTSALGISTEAFDNALKGSGGDADLFADMLYEATDGTVEFQDIVEALGGDMELLGVAFEATSGAAQAMADTQLDNLQGDITIMQSALEGVQIALSDILTPALREFVQFGSESLGTLTSALREKGIAGAVSAGIEIGTKLGQNLMSGISEKAPDVLAKAADIITGFLDKATTAYPEIAAKGYEMVGKLAEGILQNAPAAITSIGNLLVMMLDNLLTGLPRMMESGIQLIQNLATGMLQNGPAILEAIANVLLQLLQTIVTHLPEILQKGIELIGQLAAGIINAIPDAVRGMGQVLENLKNAITSVDWGALGKAIIDGIIAGLKNAGSALFNALKGLAGQALGAAKDELKINSPSKVFEHEVGESIPEGMALGITENASMVTDAVRSVSEGLTTDFSLPDVGDIGREIGATISASASTEISVPVVLDGREIARATAWYTNEQLAWEARG